MNSRNTFTKFGSFDQRDYDTFKQRLFGLVDACNVHTYCGAPDVQSLVRYIMDCIHLYGVNENERRGRQQ